MLSEDLFNAFRWVCTLFLPGPKILWASLSVAVFFADNVYLQYFALGYYYEVFINHLARHAETSNVCDQRLFLEIGGPCMETQLFMSFFAFITVHLVCHGRHGIPKLKSVVCAACFFALVFSLVTMGTCSLPSIGFGALVGTVNGVMRALFYRAVLRDPVRHVLCAGRGSLIECMTQYAHQSKLYGADVLDSHCEYCNRIGCQHECIDDAQANTV